MLRSFRSSSAKNKTSEYRLCLREQGRAHAQFNTQLHLSQKNGNGGIAGVCHIEPHGNGQDPNPKCSQAVLENAACRGASAVPAMQESRRGWRAGGWARTRCALEAAATHGGEDRRCKLPQQRQNTAVTRCNQAWQRSCETRPPPPLLNEWRIGSIGGATPSHTLQQIQ